MPPSFSASFASVLCTVILYQLVSFLFLNQRTNMYLEFSRLFIKLENIFSSSIEHFWLVRKNIQIQKQYTHSIYSPCEPVLMFDEQHRI